MQHETRSEVRSIESSPHHNYSVFFFFFFFVRLFDYFLHPAIFCH